MSAPEDPESGEPRSLRVRSYVLTQGRTRSNSAVEIETMVRVSERGRESFPQLALERKKIIELCGKPLSVAEISAHLSIPLGVAKVLVGDMAEEGLLESFQPQHGGGDERPDLQLLERVLNGLQAL